MDPPAAEIPPEVATDTLSNNVSSQIVVAEPEEVSVAVPQATTEVASVADPSPMQVDSAPLELSTTNKYPKVSLRLNEFGIYELATDEQPSADPVELADLRNAALPPSDKETATNAVEKTTTLVMPAAPQAAATPSSTVATTPVVEAVKTTAPATNSNGDRERWKQKFPSNTKVQVDIVCCKQCDGYGIADEFVDTHYCSEKCRKLGTARQAHLLKTGKVAKVAVKRKSTSSNSSAAPVECSSVVESTLESHDQSIDGREPNENKGVAKGSNWSWSKYLERRRAQAAPERLFTDPFPYRKHGFRYGMKLEGIDPEHQSFFCVMTVAEVQGFRLRLHFDGYSDSHDVWLNADSENLFPVGWCEKNGQKLRPPKNYSIANSSNLTETTTTTTNPASPAPSQTPTAVTPTRIFSWPQYLKFTGSSAAPRQLFVSTQHDAPLPSPFRVRMKLEAVDRRHSSHTLCVATVANVIGSRFLVHFDGWDSVYDYWADPTCPYVHPVGWAQEHNSTLTPPCDYDGIEGEFTWDDYLARTGSSAVPPRAFKPRTAIGFKTGMKLECVDPRNPQLIRVATVAAVKGYRLKIHFDGWSSDFDFWTDDDWPDLHPPGWCQKTGHPLQPPLTTDSAIKTDSEGRCPTAGCNGIGHIEGSRYPTHSTAEDCPYSSRNLHRDSPAFPDRLLGEDLGSEIALPPAPAKESKVVKAEPMDVTSTPSSPVPVKTGRTSSANSQTPGIDLPMKSESEAELNNRLIQVDMRADSPSIDNDSSEALTPPPPKKMKLSYFTGKTAANSRTSDTERRKSVQEPVTKENGTDEHPERNSEETQQSSNSLMMMKPSDLLDFQSNANLVTPLCWSKHAALLSDLVDGTTSSEASKWSTNQVRDFLAKFGISPFHLDKFKEEEIDGEALLYLSQSDLTDLLGVKLGPAIKIRNALLLIKERVNKNSAALV